MILLHWVRSPIVNLFVVANSIYSYKLSLQENACVCNHLHHCSIILKEKWYVKGITYSEPYSKQPKELPHIPKESMCG
jgi:hypothetical protein